MFALIDLVNRREYMKNNILLSIIVVVGLGVVGYSYHKKIMFFEQTNTSSPENNSAMANNEPLIGKPLVTMDGKVIITVESLQSEKEKIFKSKSTIRKIQRLHGH